MPPPNVIAAGSSNASERVASGAAGGGEQAPAPRRSDREMSTVAHQRDDVIGVTQEVLPLGGGLLP